jgi:DNA polymerase elongation subunit (family B)
MPSLDLHEIISKLKRCAKDLGKTPTQREFIASGISNRQLSKHGGFNKLLELAGFEPNFNPFQSAEEKAARPARILLFDIETSAIEALVWGGYDQRIAANQVVKDWIVLSVAAKWIDEDKVYYWDIRSKPSDAQDADKKVIQEIHKLIKIADIIIGHNSNKFDIKRLNTRFLYYQLPALTHYRSIDTLRIARKFFNVTFNSLSYLAEYLGVKQKKSTHAKFPGMELWKACMGILGKAQRKEGFAEMEAYNKQDVFVLEEVYKRLIPYDKSLNFNSFHQVTTCTCGSQTFTKDGLVYTAKGAYQRYICKGCGKLFKGKDNLIPKDKRKELLS